MRYNFSILAFIYLLLPKLVLPYSLIYLKFMDKLSKIKILAQTRPVSIGFAVFNSLCNALIGGEGILVNA